MGSDERVFNAALTLISCVCLVGCTLALLGDRVGGGNVTAEQTIDAKVERGTCRLVTESKSARDWPNNERCDHCGEYVAVVSPEVVRYCPSCGRRIVE